VAAFGGARPQRIRLPVLFGGGCAQSGNVVVRDPLARGLFLSERSKAEDARGVDPGSDRPVAHTGVRIARSPRREGRRPARQRWQPSRGSPRPPVFLPHGLEARDI